MHSTSARRHLATLQAPDWQSRLQRGVAWRWALAALATAAVLAACGSPDSGTSNLEFIDGDRGDPLGDASINRTIEDTGPPVEVAAPDAAVEPGDASDAVTLADVSDAITSDGATATEDAEDTGEDGASGPPDVGPAVDAVDPDTLTPPPDVAVADDAAAADVVVEPDVEAPDASVDSGGDTEEPDAEPDAVVPECVTSDECPPSDSACQVATCEAGICGMANMPVGTGCAAEPGGFEPDCVQGACDTDGACVASLVDGAPCDDDDPCTTGESCDGGGACSGGSPVLCPSAGGCESAQCIPNQGCISLPYPDGLLCDDGDACTFSTTCTDGACGGGNNLCTCLVDDDCYEDGDLCNGTPACVDLAAGGKGCETVPETVVSCPAPEDPCFKAVCVPADGSCETEVLAGATCDDGDPCTQSDTCDDSGGCAGVPIVCEDGIPCTDDLCDGGACIFPSLDGAPCDDGLPCTVTDVCADAACAGVAKECDDGDPCTIDACDTETGACTATFEEGAPCDDGSECTSDDACAQGACVGAVVSCDDENICTDDSCDPVAGCSNTNNHAPCPDEDICTGPDTCQDGVCDTGPLDCDDGLPCTADSCHESKGCVHVTDDTVCDDENPCTTDTCQLLTGCVTVPNTEPCDDDQHCTYDDACAGGLCAGQPVICNDGVSCTLDACDTETGSCVYTTDDAVCDDDNVCTLTSCDATEGCVTVDDDGAPCDDDVACTDGDICLAGSCDPGDNICPCVIDSDCNDDDLCNGVYFCDLLDNGLTACALSLKPVACVNALDGPPCLVNACEPATGDCVIVNVEDGTPCPDEDQCTEDEVCLAGDCALAEVDCDDAVDCTLDSCVPEVGCVHTPSAEACEDEVDCTVDSCLALEGCQHTPDNAPCDDAVGCTVDVCSADTGCENLEDSGPCDDGIACTLDICDPDTGCYSVPDDALCQDGSSCTDNVCGAEGCISEEVEGPCEDGNLCTQGDICVAGACQPGPPPDCDDGDPCTKNGCDPVDGECGTKDQEDGTSCADDSACTEPDACQAGLCVSGPTTTCDDAIDCTLDTCDPVTGCQHDGDDAPCDDSNPCTVDVCVVGQGCVHEPLTDFSACDDGVTGTSPDVCVAGLCRGVQTAGLTVSTLFLCEVVAARLARVSGFDGGVYALMTYELDGFLCGTVQCPDSDGLCHSRVLRLDGVTSQVTANVGGLLTGIGHDAIVGATGQVGQLAFGGATVLWSWSTLATAISDAGLAGGSWSDVWGTSFGDEHESYTLVGRVSAGGAGRIVQCVLGDGEADCANAKTDLGEWGWSSLHPVAVEGLVTESEPLAAVVAQATTSDAASGLWLTEDAEDFSLHSLGQDVTVHGTTRLSPQSAWLVGSDSLFAELGADGWTTWPILSEESTLELKAITTVGTSLVAVGHDATDDAGAWLVALDLESDASDATSWRVAYLGAQRRAHDVHATEDGVTVVGASLEADGSTRPFLWHLGL